MYNNNIIRKCLVLFLFYVEMTTTDGLPCLKVKKWTESSAYFSICNETPHHGMLQNSILKLVFFEVSTKFHRLGSL